MTRRRRKRQAEPRRIDQLASEATKQGVPVFLPTPERAEKGDLHVEAIVETVFDVDRTGQRKTGRRVVLGNVVRERDDLTARLKRFKTADDKAMLTPDQIAAAVRMEADWEAAGLEPRMVANLLGTGGGAGEGIANIVVAAKTKVHLAVQALRLGGSEVVHVVEAVVLQGATFKQVGASHSRYPDKGRQNARTEALLIVGLNLLAQHYRLGARVRQGATG